LLDLPVAFLTDFFADLLDFFLLDDLERADDFAIIDFE